MKFTNLLLAATAVVSLATPASAQMRALSDPVVPHPDPESLFTSDDPVLHRNKQAALHIQRNLLKCNEWDRAPEWLTDAYIQHNPVAASGLEGVMYYFTQVARRPVLDPCPALSPDDPNGVVAVMAEGDYVTILTRRIVPYADDPTQTYTTTWFDTWRFVDGRADEHWDPATLPDTTQPQALDVNTLLQEARDRAEIEALMWNYVRAIDSWDADAYAAVFTEDGSFGNTVGRDALRDMVSGMAAGRAERAEAGEEVLPLHHVMSNQSIEFLSPSVAVVNYYWQTVSRGSPGGPAPRMLAQGWGRDEVVKVDGEWLIRSRDVAPDGE
ncbi:nuclear transport factor 2 family protein [Aurantiacibacter gilvus]|uniref:Nuclear transport factor 2 family protein n=1 Tax=Aurantiacibacter gilvus TaxID=3139141 RepID=A0ABU9IEG1_9SPHN